MCADEGFFESDDIRQGYFKPLGEPWRKVTYANVDGLAIFEGCIVLGTTEMMEESGKEIAKQIADNPILLEEPAAQVMGVAIKGKQYRWPKRTIPYVLPADFPNPVRVTDAIAHWHQHTTIRFVPRATEVDYVLIQETTSGCASAVGRRKGTQTLILRPECSTGNIIHELGHTVGLWHEQSRADRDHFVEIRFDKIIPNRTLNFDQHIIDGTDMTVYDFGSIMHYPLTSFGIGGAQTIFPKVPIPPGVEVGQRKALSSGDISAVEELYAGEAMPLA